MFSLSCLVALSIGTVPPEDGTPVLQTRSTSWILDWVVVNPEKSKLFVASFGEHGGRIFDANNGRLIFPVICPGKTIKFASFLPDDRLFVITTDESNNNAIILDLRSGLAIRNFQCSLKFATRFAISQNAEVMAVVHEIWDTISIYDVKKGRRVDYYESPVEPHDIRLSDNGRRLYVLSNKPNSVVMDLSDGSYQELPKTISHWSVFNQTRYISEEGNLFLSYENGELLARELRGDARTVRLQTPDRYVSVSVVPEGIYATTKDGSLMFFDQRGNSRIVARGIGSSVHILAGDSEGVCCIDADATDRSVFALSQNGVVGERWPIASQYSADDVRLIRRGRMLVRYRNDLYLFAPELGHRGQRIATEVQQMAVVKEKSIVAFVRNNRLEWFSLDEKKIRGSVSIPVYDERVQLLEVPDKGILVVSGVDSSKTPFLMTVDCETGERRTVSLSHKGEVIALSISPNQKTVCAVSWKYKLVELSLLDLVKQAIVQEFSIAGNKPSSVCLLSDDRIAVAESGVYIVDLKRKRIDQRPLDYFSGEREVFELAYASNPHAVVFSEDCGRIGLLDNGCKNDWRLRTRIQGDWMHVKSIRCEQNGVFLATTEDCQILFGSTSSGKIWGRHFFDRTSGSWCFVDENLQWDGDGSETLLCFRRGGQLFRALGQYRREHLFFDKLRYLK